MPTFNKSTAEATIHAPTNVETAFSSWSTTPIKALFGAGQPVALSPPYSAGLITENTTQKAVRLLIESYQNNSDYTEIATLEDYKDAMKGAWSLDFCNLILFRINNDNRYFILSL